MDERNPLPYPSIDVNSNWKIIKHDNGFFYMAHKECDDGLRPSLIHIYTECVVCGADAPDDVIQMYRLFTL